MIKLLGKTVSDKIAAGEVVERPFSVVKELIENSIDAGATSIVVEIKKGGSQYIRVTDNGCGIPHDEAELAFLRHATSKIENAQDLNCLTTLGFRGEALSSIAAVSRTELLTKTKDSKTGTKLVIEGGETLEISQAGCPDGTTMVVRDLFYNTPARRKFMKSNASETGLVTELVTNIALAYPEIKIRLINNDNILFSTRGQGDRLDVIITVSGRQTSRNLLPVDYAQDGISIEGYVTGPGESKATRKNQIFFVNGRTIHSKVLQKGLDAAYKERLFDGRYPSAYLFMHVDPKTIDVNIHPTKQEIRFDDDDMISSFVREAVGQALMTKGAIPAVSTEKMRTIDPVIRPEPVSWPAAVKKSDQGTQIDIKNILSTIRSEENKIREEECGYKEQIRMPEARQELDFNTLDIKGVIFGTYILASSENQFYMIDQHAAHERIFYEYLSDRLSSEIKAQQMIMIPLTFECRRDDDEWIKPLSEFGFEIESFGPSSYIARAIPEFFDLSQAESFLVDYVDMLDDIKDFESDNLKDRLAMRACKSAVKAHDLLKEEEISRLISDLSKCRNPYSCPHGRPTFIRMSLSDIEKRFKRT